MAERHLLDLRRHGAEHWQGLAADILPALSKLLSGIATDRPGVRLANNPILASLLSSEGVIGRRVEERLGAGSRPVRAVMFDKSPTTNWSLGWHQDRTIVVRCRREVPGYGPWTVKHGLIHVAPPIALLAAMITIRIHLDEVDEDNAPLLIAPGSHTLGRIAEGEIASVVGRCGTVTCLADRNDIWAYATPILHASDAAVQPRRRRVLQVDYAAEDLPGDLEWLGV